MVCETQKWNAEVLFYESSLCIKNNHSVLFLLHLFTDTRAVLDIDIREWLCIKI